eukprot:TRINITY_DN16900_c0_g1_i2.p1 TRINITY_DN16900_c0_g1~~TRINITY_DN16900_c0_g1_i2.p1  ORF type:complete len:142 (-),score=36.97 TRINITY_DN16900_c0_g1_i2:23-448(-)
MRPIRADFGLWSGKVFKSGHHVSWSKKKTKRKFFPNLQKKTFFSDLLGKSFRIAVTTNVLRCMDKKGGFDNYLLLTKTKDIDSAFGSDLKRQLKKAYEDREKKKFVVRDYAARHVPIKIKGDFKDIKITPAVIQTPIVEQN